MEEHQHRKRHTAMTVWSACVVLALGPSVLVWFVRTAGLVAGCAPGPGLCHGMTLGGGLADTLSLAWGVGTDLWLLTALSFGAMLGAFCARKPLLGTLSLLLLPILTLLLPMLAVYTAKYDDCPVSSDGIGSCLLWGHAMGMSFHRAAGAADLIFAITPYCFALSVMLGLIGFFFARPKQPVPHAHLAMQMRPFDHGED